MRLCLILLSGNRIRKFQSQPLLAIYQIIQLQIMQVLVLLLYLSYINTIYAAKNIQRIIFSQKKYSQSPSSSFLPLPKISLSSAAILCSSLINCFLTYTSCLIRSTSGCLVTSSKTNLNRREPSGSGTSQPSAAEWTNSSFFTRSRVMFTAPSSLIFSNYFHGYIMGFVSSLVLTNLDVRLNFLLQVFCNPQNFCCLFTESLQ